MPHERGAYFLRTNEAGFRSDQEFGPRNGRPRIVVFGDSFAAGDGVANAERFTDRLASDLDVEVHNMAISGSGPDQQLLVLEDHLPTDADVVLWCVAAHAIDRILSTHRMTIDRYGRVVRVPRPRFVLRSGELVLEGTPVPERGEPIADAVSILPAAVEHPIRRAGRLALGSAYGRLRRIAVTAAERAGGIDSDPDYRDSESDAWRLMTALVHRFHSLCGDVPLVLVPLPTARHISGGARMTFQGRFDALSDPARGLRVFDITRDLRARPFEERASYHYARDRHYSTKGHAAVAAAIRRRLLESGILPRPSEERSSTPHDGRSEGSGARLAVEWTLATSRAALADDGREIARADEVDLARSNGYVGSVPYAAINHCMEVAGLIGPELGGIELRSPCTIEAVLAAGGESPYLAPLVRWLGAAERDVRALLKFEGRVDWVFDDRSDPKDREPEREDDAEAKWLDARLSRIRERPTERNLRRIAACWERATRRARDAARP
ncbi:MAG: hypothetical protein AAGA20_17645 [Planctomycetota bacterium]